MTNPKMDLHDYIKLYGEADLERTIQITAPPTLQEFQTRLDIEINAILREMEADRKNRMNDREDRISSEIITALSSAGYIAQKDTLQGGHVDIYVRTKQSGFKWIGEAKIWNGIEYINNGLSQLLNRYASGKCSEEALGFIIYFQIKDQAAKLIDWHAHTSKRDDFISQTHLQNNCQKNFDSSHRHLIGTEVVVSHFSANFYWNPQGG